MAFLLDAADDWQDAVPHVMHHLGINVAAWHDACDAMGPPLAFLSLIAIDRNRLHPTWVRVSFALILGNHGLAECLVRPVL